MIFAAQVRALLLSTVPSTTTGLCSKKLYMALSGRAGALVLSCTDFYHGLNALVSNVRAL